MNIKIYNTKKGIFKRNRERNADDIDYESAKDILKNNKECILLDVRSPQEYKEYHLEGSINIPVYDITKYIKNIIPNNNTQIIVYCQSGSRSKEAVNLLEKRGYKNLYNIEGGLDNI